MSYTDELRLYLKCEEASGTRFDASGNGNDATDVNTVTRAAGKVGFAAQFQKNNTEYLSVASDPSLQAAEEDFTVAFWVRTSPDITSTAYPASRYCGVLPGDYWLVELGSGTTASFHIFDGANGSVSTEGVALSVDTWYLIFAWYTAADRIPRMTVNDGIVKTGPALTGASRVGGTASLDIGAISALSGGYLDGLVDEPLFAKRIWTPEERTWLFNGGAGRTYEDFLPSGSAQRRRIRLGLDMGL